jgi:hypothetical protein
MHVLTFPCLALSTQEEKGSLGQPQNRKLPTTKQETAPKGTVTYWAISRKLRRSMASF